MTSSDTMTPPLRLRLGETHRADLRRWAENAYPRETCGLLIGAEDADGPSVVEVRKARNLELERAADRYVLDPEAFATADRDARRAGLEILGFWHSHPDSPAVPSETDRLRAWNSYAYVIVSVRSGLAGEIRVWTHQDGSFQEGRVVS